MKIVTTIRTERKGEVTLTEHDLMVLISNALKGIVPEITIDNLDWDVSQGAMVRGVTVSWSKVEPSRTVEKEI
jgi:hypothetical protein